MTANNTIKRADTDINREITPPASRQEGESHFVKVPAVNLPKGGGAIRGIGEKFSANPVTGTGSMTVPIAASPGRNGFGPQLSLAYDSGSGNGPFGLGWSLALPAITRKTEKGLPLYHDAEESDVFILSGAEDLVPVLDNNNQRFEDKTSVPGYVIHRYRPRAEGLFARIERWTNPATGDVSWRSISRDNITSWYGKTGDSRLYDPDNPQHIFSWLLCESYDDKGNAIVYEYKRENSDSINLDRVHEQNRTQTNRSANLYPKHIYYGNTVSRLLQPDLKKMEWLFEVVFDYGEDHYETLPNDNDGHARVNVLINPIGSWPVRPDPFSSYRTGFEIRGYRLCRRILMFHRFVEELGIEGYLVSATEFNYQENPVASLITSVVQSAYKLNNDGSFRKKSLPPLEFTYSSATIQKQVQQLDNASGENLPIGLDGQNFRWIDLDGEGLSGILTEQANGWFYKRNIAEGNFAAQATVVAKPSLASLAGGYQLLDLSGNGQLDVVDFDGPVAGFYERTLDKQWDNFKSFTSSPQIDWTDPNLRLIDLTGDGLADILVTEDCVLSWHRSLGEAGFDPAQRVQQALDENTGPRVLISDGTQSIYLADFSGDGLTDIVRIRNGNICYWPNLGYGRFGAKITMDNSPWFDSPDQFNQQRIQLADIDGSGTTDILYIKHDRVNIWRNQSGNGWSAMESLTEFPLCDDTSKIAVADLLGNGTACLVWSSPLPSDARRPLRYIDLMGGQKPYLLIASKNNLGAETRVQYAASTRFYLADELAGKPWITRLSFPVHVVERVETIDRISLNRFTARYAYHHGYFDGEEREFRGFGMVEQWDTEEYATLIDNANFAFLFDNNETTATNLDAASHIPPVHTKTWFHTGSYLQHARISLQFKDEYYREPGLSDTAFDQQLLPDTIMPNGLTTAEQREAVRTLKGTMLRQEIYALDDGDKQQHPYSVSEQNMTIRLVQAQAQNRHAVFFTHAHEAITYHYERNPKDPRVQHALTLHVDDYGNVLKSAAAGYGRRQASDDPLLNTDDKARQKQIHMTYSEIDVSNALDQQDHYRTPLAWQTRQYELTGYEPAAGADRFTLDDFIINSGGKIELLFDSEIAYETKPTQGRQRRLIEQSRNLFRGNDLTALLPAGVIESLALPGESYQLALTPGLLTQVYQHEQKNLLPNAATILKDTGADGGAYIDLDNNGYWWIPSGRMFFDLNTDIANPTLTATQELDAARQHFFLPRKFVDPFLAAGTVDYDKHDLFATRTQDVLGNVTQAGYDYRVLQARAITDINDNRAEVMFDTLGLVAGSAVMGKNNESGDNLQNLDADLSAQQLQAFLQQPKAVAAQLLGNATARIVYDVHRYYKENLPGFAATLTREIHVNDAGGTQSPVQCGLAYSDGFGRVIQSKMQAEPGPVAENGAIINPRWVGSGWTVFNNKGQPVRQYEPFFSTTHNFEWAKTAGVSPIIFYDPPGRAVATLHPDHSWEKVVFDPWRQESWDVNDTVLLDPVSDADVGDYFKRLPLVEVAPTWYAQRSDGGLGKEAQQAAAKAAMHAATPAIAHADSLGRTLLSVTYNRFERDGTIIDESYVTRVELDIEGNQRTVTDALDRVVMRYDYNLLGGVMHNASMEAGERWMLSDIAGNPIRAWDSRGHRFRSEYDSARRPLNHYVFGTDAAHSDPDTLNAEICFQKIEYGENQNNAKQNNLRGQVYRSFDSTGIVTSIQYDFKGNLLAGSRQLAQNYKSAVDWNTVPALEPEVYQSRMQYDALNRVVQTIGPDNSTFKPQYNEANLLNSLSVRLRGAANATDFVNNIDYNAKGQRELIAYGNSVTTHYSYDPLTFRLTNLKTLRGNQVLQDLTYTYDPSGNITSIYDNAQQTIYFDNLKTEPHADYVYDAVYRLVQAGGREHIGQHSAPQTGWNDAFRVNPPSPRDGQAMRPYTEEYQYDAVGNFLKLIHQAGNNGGSWTRNYNYTSPSPLQPGEFNNRLTATAIGTASENYNYDTHGNMLNMPHLPAMHWNFKDQLRSVDLGGGGKAYYVYDAGGERSRKVIERQNGSRQKERLYLGGFEMYRDYGGDGESITLQRETLHCMDDTQRIAMIETRTQGNDGSAAQLIRYQFSNHLGSASLELDGNGAVISYEEYYPYGSTSYQSVNNQTEVPTKRYRYTGKERDDETGFNYHSARYYAPWIGRWISADPIGISDGTNIYIYCLCNPLTLIDPTGTTNTHANKINKQIGQMTDNKLYGYLQKLSPTDRANFANSATGLYAIRANAMLNKYHMERVTKVEEVTIEGDVADKVVELPEMKIYDPETEAAAAKSGFETVEGYNFYMNTPGVIQSQDRRGFVKGLINSPAATVEGLGSLAGLKIDLSVLKVDVDPNEESGALLGEFLGPGPGTVLKAAGKTLGTVGKAFQLEAKEAGLVSKAGELARDTRGSIDLAELAKRLKPVTKPSEKAAGKAAAKSLREGATKSEAGDLYHELRGAAGHGEGVDFVGKGYIKELASHYGPMQVFQFIQKSAQNLKDAVKYRLENNGLYPIRMVEHVYIDPRTGKSVKIHKP